MKNIWEKIGNLDVMSARSDNASTAVVLFHGYGADANDLYPLHKYLDVDKDISWFFPQGTKSIILGPGFSGRAWFNIDVEAMEDAMRNGTYRDLGKDRPPEMDSTLEIVKQAYDHLREDFDTLIIGGFSQGAMLSTEIAISSDKKPDGLVILSGSIVDRERWKGLIKESSPLKFFMSHGNKDAILNPKAAGELYGLLKEGGHEGEFAEFSGGHEIPPEILSKLKNFISANI